MHTVSRPPFLRTVLLMLLLVATTVWLAPTGPAYADRNAPSDGVWPLDPRPQVVAGSTRRPPGGAPDTAASTSPGAPGSRCTRRSAGTGHASPARSPGGASSWSTTAATRTTYEPVDGDRSHVGDPRGAGAVIGRLQLSGRTASRAPACTGG